jgi:hypothetical protein
MTKATHTHKKNLNEGFQEKPECKVCLMVYNKQMNSAQFESVSTLIRKLMMKATCTSQNNPRKAFQQTLKYKLIAMMKKCEMNPPQFESVSV